MNTDQLTNWLDSVQTGQMSVDEAVGLISQDLISHNTVRTVSTAEASLDVDRRSRCGYAEVVYAEGKSATTIVDIFHQLQAHDQPCLATRVSAEQAEHVQREFPAAVHHPTARTLRLPHDGDAHPVGEVVVITAGTTDRPVADEAIETLTWMGIGCRLIPDIGVASPHRLIERVGELQAADAIIVVAGMEGALPSVVGGWVGCPVIAVPTGVGYGASLGGMTALLGMLNSCAANVTVVNIDAGFKGGYVAGLIAGRANSPRV